MTPTEAEWTRRAVDWTFLVGAALFGVASLIAHDAAIAVLSVASLWSLFVFEFWLWLAVG
jgi:hypothetical protein